MVRAITRIIYRYYNDGDYFFRGYGKETCGNSATYLKTKTPYNLQLGSLLKKAQIVAGKPDNDDEYSEDDQYLKGLQQVARVIVDYVKSKKGNYTPNNIDSR